MAVLELSTVSHDVRSVSDIQILILHFFYETSSRGLRHCKSACWEMWEETDWSLVLAFTVFKSMWMMSWSPDSSCVFRANCSEYFPIFITVLWTSGLFFSQGEPTAESLTVTVCTWSVSHRECSCVAGLSSVCGLLYLYGRLCYFRGYSQAAQQR